MWIVCFFYVYVIQDHHILKKLLNETFGILIKVFERTVKYIIDSLYPTQQYL